MKEKKINGRTYQISKKAKNAYDDKIAAFDIFDAYGKPSSYKVRIWEDWSEVLGPIWIHGYNSCAFSISGKLTDETDGTEYAVLITKDNRYAYKL